MEKFNHPAPTEWGECSIFRCPLTIPYLNLSRKKYQPFSPENTIKKDVFNLKVQLKHIKLSSDIKNDIDNFTIYPDVKNEMIKEVCSKKDSLNFEFKHVNRVS